MSLTNPPSLSSLFFLWFVAGGCGGGCACACGGRFVGGRFLPRCLAEVEVENDGEQGPPSRSARGSCAFLLGATVHVPPPPPSGPFVWPVDLDKDDEAPPNPAMPPLSLVAIRSRSAVKAWANTSCSSGSCWAISDSSCVVVAVVVSSMPNISPPSLPNRWTLWGLTVPVRTARDVR